ncbi:HtaA domain-containing protein [Mycobacterium intracellulare]|uniref:HtaA domain-containing protein n=1 Tax=Mycobacterium intracellulare TaxID=1767 RepID=UPI00080B0689|nr:HtaA domain-containing protein [Mycobacterium intracellulare]OCB22456.1 hypothetical protein A5689_17605 [Mycobacterium intracellulare subsp. yongonense]
MTEPKDVGLRWAVKRSFLDYVARTPDGRAYVAGGVRANADGEVIFPPAEPLEAAVATDTRVFAFGGEVRYLAHGGLLHVIIADPVLTVTGDAGVLTVAAVDEEDQPTRIELVTFTVGVRALESAPTTWESSEVRLTADGATVFGGVYSAGELMAPLHVHLPPR